MKFVFIQKKATHFRRAAALAQLFIRQGQALRVLEKISILLRRIVFLPKTLPQPARLLAGFLFSFSVSVFFGKIITV